ncbi:hypothetical protein WA158_007002 [Blastocystis sp. Blastoise]
METILKLFVAIISNVIIYIVLFVVLTLIYWRQIYFPKRKYTNKNRKGLTIGVFHPYANAGGGGEKVLWVVLKALEELSKNYPINVLLYTGDKESLLEMLEKTNSIFHIDIDTNILPIKVIYLQKRDLIEPSRYPHFTILCQSLGSIVLGFEALSLAVPDIFLDTIGLGFTYPLAKYICCCKVITYTHYPIISTDMLERVQNRESAVNNNIAISNSPFLSTMKLIYYYMFASLYKMAGRCADLVFANSTFTYNNLITLWNMPNKTIRLYPPCDVDPFESFSVDSRENIILSIGQFRPEKDHKKQLLAFRRFLDNNDEYSDMRLVLIGGARNKEDKERVEQLKQLVNELDMNNKVIFEVNAPFDTLLRYMQTSLIGIHTMRKEHFGISIVEMMASGLIMIGHNSGGPKDDIIVPAYPPHFLTVSPIAKSPSETQIEACGFLAETVNEYSDTIEYIVTHPNIRNTIIKNARNKVNSFSTEEFIKQFNLIFENYLK